MTDGVVAYECSMAGVGLCCMLPLREAAEAAVVTYICVLVTVAAVVVAPSFVLKNWAFFTVLYVCTSPTLRFVMPFSVV